ncbi:hypothetical protein [Xanthomonas sp. 60]
MRLRNILRHLMPLRAASLDAAMTVEARPSALVHKDFREFTAPARSQRGGALSVAPHRADRFASMGIVPGMGGNIP